jgi:ribosome-associated protein
MKPPIIAFNELEFTYVRSSGPGGQNVNKVNSKAQLRWRPSESLSLTEEEKIRLQSRLSLTRDGDLVIQSGRFRDQHQNRDDCIRKFQEILKKAFHDEKPRKKTKPSYSSRVKRVQTKRKQSEKKAGRGFGRGSFED